MCIHYVDELFLDSQDQSPKHLGDIETTEGGKTEEGKKMCLGDGWSCDFVFWV